MGRGGDAERNQREDEAHQVSLPQTGWAHAGDSASPRTPTIKTVSPPFRSYVLVSRDQIARNFRAVRDLVGAGTEVAAVVKADAYGHGAIEVSRVVLAEGARWLAVSSVDEGVQLRSGGILDARILVMGGFLPYEGDALVEFDLTPAVHTLDQIRAVDRLAAGSGKPLRYHLKIDSGMGRLGTRASASDILAALAATPHAQIEGLMTHFASAADYNSSRTAAGKAGIRWCGRDTASTATSLRRAALLPSRCCESPPRSPGRPVSWP